MCVNRWISANPIKAEATLAILILVAFYAVAYEVVSWIRWQGTVKHTVLTVVKLSVLAESILANFTLALSMAIASHSTASIPTALRIVAIRIWIVRNALHHTVELAARTSAVLTEFARSAVCHRNLKLNKTSISWQILAYGVLGFWGFGVLGLGFRV